jgi:hypothetical protein
MWFVSMWLFFFFLKKIVFYNAKFAVFNIDTPVLCFSILVVCLCYLIPIFFLFFLIICIRWVSFTLPIGIDFDVLEFVNDLEHYKQYVCFYHWSHEIDFESGSIGPGLHYDKAKFRSDSLRRRYCLVYSSVEFSSRTY